MKRNSHPFLDWALRTVAVAVILATFAFASAQAVAAKAPAEDMTMSQTLKISTFKDISAFILETVQQDKGVKIEIKYVKNADEAHEDLKSHKADLVFMSYDDTLSIVLQDQYADIAAFMPIHGGILDLCGAIDLAVNHNRVGIDTNSGYARALRVYLQHQFPKAQDYQQLVWVMAGATNLRYEKLRDGEIDATLLNPPYSYMPSISQIGSLIAVIGDYQGLVANLNKSWLAKPAHQHLLEQFIENYHKTVNSMKL